MVDITYEALHVSKSKESESKQVSDLQDILSDFSQFYIVILLSEGPIHGYGIIRAFKQRTGKPLSAGTLYPFLQGLESKGFVEGCVNWEEAKDCVFVDKKRQELL